MYSLIKISQYGLPGDILILKAADFFEFSGW